MAVISRLLGLNKRSGKIKWTFKDIVKNFDAYLFIAPFIIIFTVFTVAPVVISIIMSFTYYNLLETPKFIGWQNYINLFLNDDIFLISIKNTLLLAFITGPVGYIASLLFAWFINELQPRIRAIMIVIFYAPVISGNVYMIWSIMFSGDSYGYINGMLLRFGLVKVPIQWLSNPEYMLSVIIIVVLWMSLGAGFLAFVAGFQTIDKTLYEAGYVEGVKNRWQELWFITLPAMKPQLLFGAVMSITASFSVSDITIALAGFPSTDYAAHTVVNHLIDYGNIRFEMGYACSIATILFVLMMGVNKFVQSLIKKVGA